jgi:addiction module RelE/StbE family toxin
MRIVYKKRFEKQLKKLPLNIRERFYERLNLFIDNHSSPILNNHSVDMIYPGCRSINVTGDYRAIYEEVGVTAYFIQIGTHSELYG